MVAAGSVESLIVRSDGYLRARTEHRAASSMHWQSSGARVRRRLAVVMMVAKAACAELRTRQFVPALDRAAPLLVLPTASVL
jgi:hypothetical protein